VAREAAGLAAAGRAVRMPDMPGFVFFDVDDTLLDDGHATAAGARAFFAEHRDEFPGPADEFVRLWATVTARHIDRWHRGECSHLEQRHARLRDVWRKGALSDAEADRIFAGYLRHYLANVRLFPDALPCIESLAGMPVGVITNGDSELQRAKLRSVGLLDRFQPVFVSGDIGVDKPDPRIFREAARLAGLAPEECIYVGDRLESDALGAGRAGMRGVWLDRAGRAEATPHGIAVIGGLVELSRLVKQRGTA